MKSIINEENNFCLHFDGKKINNQEYLKKSIKRTKNEYRKT